MYKIHYLQIFEKYKYTMNTIIQDNEYKYFFKKGN